MSRFDALDSDTIETLLTWGAGVEEPFLSDDVLVVEMEDTLRSRMPVHDFIPTQYAGVKGGSCGYYDRITCGKPRPDHTA